LLVGQVPREFMDREAQQEIEYRRMMGPLAKWIAQIDRVERIPELVQRAFRVACAGRQGPVVLVLPEDVLEEHTTAIDCPPAPPAYAYPGTAELAEMRALIAASKRPILIAGGAPWSDGACAAMAQFAQANDLPLAASYQRMDVVPTDHPCAVGELAVSSNPALLKRLREADLFVAIGTRLSEPVTQDYTLMEVPVPRVPLVHVHPSAEEIGSVYRPTLAMQCGVSEFALSLGDISVPRTRERSAWRAELRDLYLADINAPALPLRFHPGEAMTWLREQLPADAIVTFDAGAFAHWPRRFLSFGRPSRLLAPISGSMNYGIHAGIAASLQHPDRRVVVCVGDGGFTMGEAELATARRYGAHPIVLLFNNGQFGSVRVHQERRYPGRGIGMELTNPDFVMLATSYGAHAERVERTEDFAPAWGRAVASGVTSVIELVCDPEQLNSRLHVNDLRRAKR